MHAVRGVVRAGARDDRPPAPELGYRELEQTQLLLIGEGRPLPRRAGDDEPVRAVLEQVRADGDECLLVDAAVVCERRYRGGDDAPVGHRG